MNTYIALHSPCIFERSWSVIEEDGTLDGICIGYGMVESDAILIAKLLREHQLKIDSSSQETYLPNL